MVKDEEAHDQARAAMRVTLRPCSGRRAEQRARRHVLRQIDRVRLTGPAKQDADNQLNFRARKLLYGHYQQLDQRRWGCGVVGTIRSVCSLTCQMARQCHRPTAGHRASSCR